MEQVTAGMTQT